MKMSGTRGELEEFCVCFEVPTQFLNCVERFFSQEEISFVLEQKKTIFAENDTVGEHFIQREYKRGLISKVDEDSGNYQINNFYGFLDIMVVSRKEEYDALFSKEEKLQLDAWYFNEYYQWVLTQGEVPSEDKVLPLNEMLDFIDEQKDRPVYLNNCDCKSLRGDCGLPRRTCITYKNGINTFADRGLSERIDAKKAKEIVIAADQSGLMHTCNPNGICNCCDDCCYLFRGQKNLNSYGLWPASAYIVEMDSSKCVACGRCVGRCRMNVFTKENRKIYLDADHCVGCGLCVNTCPVQALKLVNRVVS